MIHIVTEAVKTELPSYDPWAIRIIVGKCYIPPVSGITVNVPEEISSNIKKTFEYIFCYFEPFKVLLNGSNVLIYTMFKLKDIKEYLDALKEFEKDNELKIILYCEP